MDQIWGLKRSVTDAKVVGVCAALSERWRLDPLVVRMATVILMLSAGIGVVLYVAAGLLLPREGENTAPLERAFPVVRTWSKRNLLVGTLVVAAVFAVMGGSVFPLSVMPVMVIAAAWYFGYQLPKQRAVQASTPAALPAPGMTASAVTAPTVPVRPGPQFGPQSGPPRPDPHIMPPPLPAAGVEPAVAPPRPQTPDEEPSLAEIVAEMERATVEQRVEDQTPAPLEAAPADTPAPATEERTLADIVAEMDRKTTTRQAEDPVGEPWPPAAQYSRPPEAHYVPPPVAPSPHDDAPRGARPSRSSSKVARRLRLIVLITMVLAVGGLAALTAAGVTVAPVMWAAVPAAVAAAGLVISGWLGRRPRWLMAITLVTTLVAVGINSSQYLAQFDDPRRFEEPIVITELPGDDISSMTHDVTVDLTGVELNQDAHLVVRANLGDVSVQLPRHVNVVVHADSRMGEVINRESGEKITTEPARVTWQFPADREGAPTLTLDLSSELGDVEVHR
ncbi:PspC domain-containing protein [Enemella sp. A6]|uniref:PspC domain-containing protein n=1 Tax=Enemella sp. A6 TaxID=3440152 RepID=UPI003EBFF3E1